MTPADTMRAAVEALEGLMRYASRNICMHEETKRGGVLWEICCSCGAKWADDRGGKPPYEDPSELIAAEDALSLLRSALSDDALRRAGAAGPLGDPDVLASPLPNEVLQLLNHVEDVVGDEAKRAAGVAPLHGAGELDILRRYVELDAKDDALRLIDKLRNAGVKALPPSPLMDPLRDCELMVAAAQECGAFRFVWKVSGDPPSYTRFTDAQLAAFLARVRTVGVPEAPEARRERLSKACGEALGWNKPDGVMASDGSKPE